LSQNATNIVAQKLLPRGQIRSPERESSRTSLLHQMAAFNSPVWFSVGFEEPFSGVSP
jgi:hypothetical protein